MKYFQLKRWRNPPLFVRIGRKDGWRVAFSLWKPDKPAYYRWRPRIPTMAQMVICPACRGEGDKNCDHCKGRGTIVTHV